MSKLCIVVGTTVCSYAFWAIGAALGFSFFASFMLSGVGSCGTGVRNIWSGC